MKARSIAVAAAAVLAGLSLFAARTAAQTSGLTVDLLRNSTYPSEFTLSKTAPLVDGRYDQRAALGPVEGPRNPAVVFFQSATIGPDYAVVILSTNTGGSGIFLTMHVVTSAAGVAAAGPGLFLGDRWRINSVTIAGDRVRLDVIRHGPTEPFCCPTLADLRDYVREGNRLRLVSSTQPDATPGAGPLPPSTGNAGLARADDGVTGGLLLIATLVLVLAARRTLRGRLDSPVP